MIVNALIFLSEVTKLGLLYLANDYGLNSTITLIFCWLIWEFAFAIILGKFSDVKGRKLMLVITVCASVLVSLLGRTKNLFIYSLFVDGILASATLPIAFAAKNDENPTRSKRLTYAEAFQYRSLPWIIVPLACLVLKFPENFWKDVALYASLISFVLVIFLKDKKDKDLEYITKKTNLIKPARVFKTVIFASILAFFIAECSYQSVSYLVEASENIVFLTKSYILFGLGLFLTASLHRFIPNLRNISLSELCSIIFFSTFFYFLIKFLSFSWEDSRTVLNYTEKAVLGASSGVYIPLVYSIVCDKFKTHQQGILCGILEATTTAAEIIAPGLAFVLIKLNFPSNVIFLIIGLGFFLAFCIIRGRKNKFMNFLRRRFFS